jgi:hypothetical protein
MNLQRLTEERDDLSEKLWTALLEIDACHSPTVEKLRLAENLRVTLEAVENEIERVLSRKSA